MRKKVLVALSVLKRLLQGYHVEGSLYYDKSTGELTFTAYNRLSRDKSLERVVCELEHGKLIETPLRYKFINSVKKSLGQRLVSVIMHRELKTAMDTLEIEEILDHV